MLRYSNTSNRHLITTLVPFCILIGIILNLFYLVKVLRNTSKHTEKCEIDSDHFARLLHKYYSNSIQNTDKEESPSNDTLQSSLFAVQSGGGLGNNLFELLALLGIASTVNRIPIVNAVEHPVIDAIYKRVQPIFPKLVDQFHVQLMQTSQVVRVPLNSGACCRYDNPEKVSKRKERNLMIDGHYFQSFKYFHHLRPKIRQWLSPSRITLARAEMMLPVSKRDHFIICTHIRRGDFTNDGVHQPSDAHFTRRATDYLVSKYSSTRSISVVVLGNDPIWAYSVFHDRVDKLSYITNQMTSPPVLATDASPEYKAVLTPTLSPEIDLAFSNSYCDVVLITSPSSTFGWWLAYLAKPSSITYYRDIVQANDSVRFEMDEEDFYPKEWIKLGNDPQSGEIRKFAK